MHALTPGTSLGPYEIIAPLGAGGMGEVYRAKDTRLGRDVAIKVLPASLAGQPELRARFELEARTVSSLDHPHICVLHDVGRAAIGAGEDAIDYLVMELVEGETLADRLSRGALPSPEVLRLGGQIADALDRAHRAGVVHRDLKPANVMLTKRGAKLMDFGLARVAAPVAGAVLSGTHSPTVAAPLTAQGALVGTFQYMAPEQLEGREVDARADLWALGCVLHEMATAKRAFEGRSQASLISAILASDPPPVSQLVPMSPPALDRLVAACLAKDPADRVQSAHDVRLQLQWMGEPASGSGGSLAGVPSMPSARRARWVVPVALAVGLLGLAAAIFMALGRRSPAEPFTVLEIPRPPALQLTSRSFGTAISPDGRMVISYGKRGDDEAALWRWSLEDPEPQRIAGDAIPWFLEWSPDSRSIAFIEYRSRMLMRLPASGGTPARLTACPDSRGLSWGSKDVMVFAPNASGPLLRLPATGGTPEPATVLDASRGEAGHRYPCFLPDGEHFLYTVFPAGPEGFAIRMGVLGSMESEFVMHAECAPVYAAPGWLVFAQSGRIVVQRFDPVRRRLSGQPVPIADAPLPSDITAEPVVSASASGALLHLATPRQPARLEWWDRTGHMTRPVELPAGDWQLISLSPDQRAAVARSGGDVWSVDLERSAARRLLRSAEIDLQAAWSADGQRVACSAREQGRPVIIVFDRLAGAPADTLRAIEALFLEPLDWSENGRTLLVAALGSGSDASTSWDVWKLPMDGGAPEPYAQSAMLERFARLSPDGLHAAVGALVDGQGECSLLSYPDPGQRVQLPTEMNALSNMGRIAWEPSGRAVLLAGLPGSLWRVPLVDAGGRLVPGREQRLFEIPQDVTGIDTRDGERFLVSRTVGDALSPSLRLLRGWQQTLAR